VGDVDGDRAGCDFDLDRFTKVDFSILPQQVARKVVFDDSFQLGGNGVVLTSAANKIWILKDENDKKICCRA